MDGTADTSPSAEVVRKAVIEIFDGFSFSKLSTFEDLSTNLETLSLTLPPAPPLRDRSGKADDGTGSTAQRGDARGSAGGMAKRVENVFVQLNQRLKELEEQEAVMRRWTTDATKNYNTALTALRAESIEALRMMHNDVGRTMTKQRAEMSAALSALETRIVNVNLLALQSASKARNDAITARTETLEVGLRSARKDVGELEDRLYWLSLASGVMIMVVLSLVMTVVTLQSKSEEYGKREGLRRPGGGDDVPPTPPSNTSKPKRSSKKKKTNSRAKSKGRTR
jgi:hypothetical protein